MRKYFQMKIRNDMAMLVWELGRYPTRPLFPVKEGGGRGWGLDMMLTFVEGKANNFDLFFRRFSFLEWNGIFNYLKDNGVLLSLPYFPSPPPGKMRRNYLSRRPREH